MPGPFLVVDLGGGSTEFVLGDREVAAARSVDLGSVRLTERHLHSDPPSPEEVLAASTDIDAGIDLAAQVVDLASVTTLVGVAGTITTTMAHALGLAAYDRARLDGAELPTEEVRAAARDLTLRTRTQRGELPFMHPGRVDVIGAGALLWHRIIERVERLEEERKALADDIKDIFAEAKSAGFDVKVVRQLIRLRKQEPAEIEEQETLLDLYRRALGM